MEDWINGNPIGSAMEHIINSQADIPFIIQDTKGNFHSHLFAQPQRCRVRKEGDVLKEIIVAALENGTRGPLYFIWLKDQEKATLDHPPYATNSLTIRALSIGN